MLKVWNRIPALGCAAALFGSLLLTSACGDEEKEKDDEAPAVQDKTWSYIEFPDTRCRDGSAAGISLNLNSESKNVMIYLEGGGACFDTLTCLGNPTNISPSSTSPSAGLFDRTKAENPVKDWNFVYVPYCTGDTHAGAKPDATVEGVNGTQQFVGYTNMTKFLEKLKTTFPEVDRVLLTGISAGGFGASANVGQVMRTFPNAKGNLLDDSGPAMSSEYLATCLQAKWRDLWALDQTILKECGDACPKDDDFILDYALHLAEKYSDQKSGMIETTNDGIITRFFGTGLEECTHSFIQPGIPEADFKAGLLDFRERVKQYENFGTFYPPGVQHTWLGTGSLYTAEVDGVRMIDWVADIIADRATSHVGGN